MKCSFCLNEMEMTEVKTDDCMRICWECSNCGMRTPGAEQSETKFTKEDEQVSIEFAMELINATLPIWNPEGEFEDPLK